jgi:hypothetical protein
MKSRIVFFTLLIAASGFAAERWWSPDKAYSILPPAGWKQNSSNGDAGSSYSFTSPDGKSEVRISAAYHISLPDTMPDEVLGMAFPKERGITPIAPVRGAAWDGLRREYTGEGESTRWLGEAARHGSTVVLLTMKAPAKEFGRLRSVFESVSQSLTFAE